MNGDNGVTLNLSDDSSQDRVENDNVVVDEEQQNDEQGMDDSEEEDEEEEEEDDVDLTIIENELVCTNDNDVLIDNWEEDIETDSSDPSLLLHEKAIASSMNKCRTLFKMIKKSTTLTMYMVHQRKTAKIKRSIIPNVRSRWNSTFIMIDSLLALRSIFEKLFNDKHHLNIKHEQTEKLNQLEISSADWNHLSQLHHVLQVFFQSTKILSGKTYPTIRLAYFIVSRLKMFLNNDKDDYPFVKRLKRSILCKMTFCFDQDNEQSDLLKVR